MTIRLRFFTFAILILVAVVPVSVLSLTVYKQMHRFVSQTVQSQLASSANEIQSDLSHRITILSNGLSLLADKESVINGIDDLIYSIHLPDVLEGFVLNTPLVESLYLVGADGYVIESYKGNILAMEQSNLLKVDYQAHERISDFGAKSIVKLVDNYALLERSGRHHAISLAVPVYSDRSMDGVVVRGHLVAVVPIYKLIDAASELVENQESVAIYHKDERLEGNIIGDDDYDVTHSSRMVVSGANFQNALWLTVSVGQRLESLSKQANETLAPGLASAAVVIGIIVLVVMLFAHMISRSFDQLYRLISDFEKGRESAWDEDNRFLIREFSDVAQLLAEMKRTIGAQLREVNEKNNELARIDKLRAGYLQEVQELNNQLEYKVEERTQELEASMDRLAQSNFFFQQLTQLRRIMEASIGNRQIVADAIRILGMCFPGISMVMHLPRTKGHRAVFENLLVELDDHHELHERVKARAYPRWDRFSVEFQGQVANVFGIRCGAEEFGWLLVNEPRLSEENSNRILLFITELSSFLENRTLNEELDFLARTDALTGIRNRKAFDEMLFTLETQLDAEVGLFVIDVNGLKRMNDEKGHEKGDMLIRSVADVLKECCDGITQDFYRIGGDEFAVVLVGEKIAQADILETRFQNYQNRHLNIELDSFGGEPVVSFSVGYACTTETEFNRLYKTADQKMYRNKQQFYNLLRRTEL